MAQLLHAGEAICRWCKDPLEVPGPGQVTTRPREVHPGCAPARRRAQASRSRPWTRAMDDALTAADVADLQQPGQGRTPAVVWAAEIAEVTDALVSVQANSPPLEADVRALIRADARLLIAMRERPLS